MVLVKPHINEIWWLGWLSLTLGLVLDLALGLVQGLVPNIARCHNIRQFKIPRLGNVGRHINLLFFQITRNTFCSS